MSARTPSLNWLRVFEAAARTESFARAAAQLNMSAAAVSQQIKALETQLGAQLFRRHAHSVGLTDAGRAYFPVVQQALLSLDTATTSLFGESREQQLFVHAALVFAHGILAPALPAFHDIHPGINPVLTTASNASELGYHFWDMQIIFGDPPTGGDENDPLLAETVYPVATPDIVGQIIRPADLLNWPLIEVTSHRAGWAYTLRELRLSPAGAQFRFTDNSVMACAMASAGAGIALARAPATDLAMRSAGLRPCIDGFSIPGQLQYHLVYPSLSSLRPAARTFRSWLLDYLG